MREENEDQTQGRDGGRLHCQADTEQDEETPDVHRVADEAIRTRRDKPPRRVERRRGTSTPSDEGADAPRDDSGPSYSGEETNRSEPARNGHWQLFIEAPNRNR